MNRLVPSRHSGLESGAVSSAVAATESVGLWDGSRIMSEGDYGRSNRNTDLQFGRMPLSLVATRGRVSDSSVVS